MYYCSDNMALAITLKQTTFKRSGLSVKKIEFNCFFICFKEETSRFFSAIEHIYAWSSLTVNKSVCLSSRFHNFSKFYFALPVRRRGVCSVSAPFGVDIYFFVKKLDSDCQWCITSLATRSILSNRVNIHHLPICQHFDGNYSKDRFEKIRCQLCTNLYCD